MEQCKKPVLARHPDDPAQWEDGSVVKQSLPWPYDPGVGYPVVVLHILLCQKVQKTVFISASYLGTTLSPTLVLWKLYFTLQEHFQEF